VLDVQIIRYTESAEMFQSMSLFEDEKRRFKSLIELKPLVSVDLKDYKLERQKIQIELNI
jgi:hypothetical protein